MSGPNLNNCSFITNLLALHQISTNYSLVHHCGQLLATHVNVATSPGRGCEVFVTKLPLEILMRKLYDFLVVCGDIYQIRLLIAFSGYCKGTAYVKYFNQEAATKAALLLSTCEIQPGYPILIKVSFDINKLMMTMIPKHVTYELVVQEVSRRVGFGLISVRPDEKENNENNSYSVMLTYETHKHAMQARKLLWPGIHLWNAFVLVDWTQQHDSKLVRKLYFRNVSENMTRFDLFDFIKRVIDIQTVLKIHVESGTGYIVFSSDKHRKLAKEALEGCTIFGKKLELRLKNFSKKRNASKKELSVGENLLNSPDEVAKMIDDCKDYAVTNTDELPVFHTAPVYTKPGIYNELEAMFHIVHNFLHERFPFSTWTVLDSINNADLKYFHKIRIVLTVNGVQYTFLLAQVYPSFVSLT